jgi:hypothetical protein
VISIVSVCLLVISIVIYNSIYSKLTTSSFVVSTSSNIQIQLWCILMCFLDIQYLPKWFMCWRLGPQLVDPIIEKWLDHEDSALINGLICSWIPNWMDYWELMKTLEGEGWLKEECPAFEGCSLSPVSYLCLFASWLQWGKDFCSTTLCPPWCSGSPQAHNSGAKWSSTETSEIVSQNKSFLLLIFSP